jgi:hypothetical protein
MEPRGREKGVGDGRVFLLRLVVTTDTVPSLASNGQSNTAELLAWG